MKSQLFTPFFFQHITINALAVIALVRFVYFPIYKKKDFYFTFFLLNFLTFVLTFLLNRTGAFSSFGTGFGLLAAFSLLRLRTETISIKDMTYLFMVLTLGLINATMTGPFYELIAVNVLVVGMAFGLDKEWLSKSIKVKTIELDNLENIRPEKQELLITELRNRLGLDIRNIDIDRIDLARSRAEVKIYYY